MKSPLVFYVSSQGNMQWSGRHPQPLEDGSDGPCLYPHSALLKARRARRTGSHLGAVEIRIAPGDYFLYEPLHLQEEDSDITFIAEVEGTARFHSAIRIEGWKEDRLQGVELWSTDLPDELRHSKVIRSFFVNGERRSKPVHRSEGWDHFENVPGLDPTLSIDRYLDKIFQGSQRVVIPKGIIPENEENVEEAEILVSHFWVLERLPIESWDPKNREIRTRSESLIALRNDHQSNFAKFRIENLKSSLKNPGEWYVDRKNLKIYYIPKTGERINEVRVEIPSLSQLIRVIGTVGHPVKRVAFEGIEFYGTESLPPQDFSIWSDPYSIDRTPRKRDASFFNTEYHNNICQTGRTYGVSPQAAYELPGVLHFRHASFCRVEKCRFHGLGVYAIILEEGSTRCEVLNSEFYDLGAGAIQMDGGFIERGEAYLNGYHHIIGNHIYDTGYIYPAGVGILSMISIRNRIELNHIHHTSYSGISCGWMWGVDRVVAYGNQILRNHIHHVGVRGGLNDMAAIYALGVQPGTVIEENMVYEVSTATYGGGGIYLDQGGSLMEVSRNFIFGLVDYGLVNNITRGNRVLDNLLIVNCKKSAILLYGAINEEKTNEYPSEKMLFEKNVIYVPPGKSIFHDQQLRFERQQIDCAMNRYYFDSTEKSKKQTILVEETAGHLFSKEMIPPLKNLPLEEMRQRGFESFSEEIYDRSISFEKGSMESLIPWIKTLKSGRGGWTMWFDLIKNGK